MALGKSPMRSLVMVVKVCTKTQESANVVVGVLLRIMEDRFTVQTPVANSIVNDPNG